MVTRIEGIRSGGSGGGGQGEGTGADGAATGVVLHVAMGLVAVCER